MSAHARQYAAAQRAFENLSPPEPDALGEQAAWAASNAARSITDDCPDLPASVAQEIEEWLAERIEVALEAEARRHD